MTHQNEQSVRDLYRAFTDGDAAKMQELFDPDVAWHQPGRSVLAGDHLGVNSVFEFFGRVARRILRASRPSQWEHFHRRVA